LTFDCPDWNHERIKNTHAAKHQQKLRSTNNKQPTTKQSTTSNKISNKQRIKNNEMPIDRSTPPASHRFLSPLLQEKKNCYCQPSKIAIVAIAIVINASGRRHFFFFH